MRIIIVAVAVAAIGCVDQDLSTVEQNTELSWYGWQSKTVANGHTTFVGPYIDNATDGLRYGIAVSYPAISGFTKWCISQGFVALTSADETWPTSGRVALAASTTSEWTYGVVSYPAIATTIVCDNELPADIDPCYGCWDY